MSLARAEYDELLKKRNGRASLLFSNGVSLLLGVLSSVNDFSLVSLRLGNLAVIVASAILILSSFVAFLYYHRKARKFKTT